MRKISFETYLDKVYGCFIGKAVTGNIGAPYEGVKMPMELQFSPDMIDCSMPNDDLDLQIIWLDVLEEKGPDFTSKELLDRFVHNCKYSPGEYSIMRKNFMRAVYPPYSGEFANDFYIEGMGCPIRSEVWACVAVGNPELACSFAVRDGQMDHYGESIQAERFLAALETEAFFESDMDALLDKGLSVLPEDSKFAELVRYTRDLCKKYSDIRVVLNKVLFRYGHPDCTNMYQNMGITIASLLLGEGDIIKTGMMALNCGFDTDCTCATAGAIIGIIRGGKALCRDYDLSEITYTLGVQTRPRSNRISDLAEEIAHLGVQLCESVNDQVKITGLPEKRMRWTFEEEKKIAFAADYEDRKPYITLGGSRRVNISLQSKYGRDMKLKCRITPVNGLLCDEEDFCMMLPAGGIAQRTVTFTLPADTKLVYETNRIWFTAADENGDTVLQEDFGIVGAAPWKLCGPFWRTEPICTTEAMRPFMHEAHPYGGVLSQSKTQGNGMDQLRQFHLNFAVDTQTEYAGNALFTPVAENAARCDFEENLVSIPEDSFHLKDFFGFRGPCAAYLSRELMADEDTEVYMQIGHSAPYALYVNGENVSQRDYCDGWTAENVHIGPMMLKKGLNRIALRLTRVNEDAKYSLIISKGIAMDEHFVNFASVNPMYFE